MMRRLALLLCLLACACTTDSSATELTLQISSALSVPDELDRLTVSVIGQEATTDPEADLRKQPLPRSLTLVHSSGPLGPLQITVRGFRGEQLVVQKDLRAWFVEGQDAQLAVELERACVAVQCTQGETCEQGSCSPVVPDVDAGEPPALDAALPARDAAPRDAQRADANGELDAAADASFAEDAALAEAGAAAAEDASVPDAAADAAPDAGTPDAGPAPSRAGAPPVCSLSLPAIGDRYQVNTAVPLLGTCSDPETGPISAGLRWSSQLEGALGEGGTVTATLTKVGTHQLSLCASDPRDADVSGCASVDVSLTLIAQPTVSISGLSQSGSSMQPFSSASALSIAGAGSGAGVTLAWTDDLQGVLGSTPSVSVGTPLVGRHSVTLTVRDRNGVEKFAVRSYVVVAAGESNLVSPFGEANATLDAAGDPGVSVIASDPALRVYVPNSSGVLYRLDGNALATPASVAIGQPPLQGLVQDVQLVFDKGLSYLATTQGLTVCRYVAQGGVLEPCTTYGRGISAQSINLLSVLRMAAGSSDVLLEGTDNGVFLPDAVGGSTRGTVLLRGRKVYDMVALSGQAALATDNGLYLLSPVAQTSTRFVVADGLPANQLSSLAAAQDGSLWIGTSNGLAHYEPAATIKWTTFNVDSGLAGNKVTSVAVERSTQLPTARDIVWVTSNGGVTRLDTLSRSTQRLTTADGLPSNEVLAVHVLANGVKLFGTSKGLAHYVGP